MKVVWFAICFSIGAGLASSPTDGATKPEPLLCGAHEVEDCIQDCPPERSCNSRLTMYYCFIHDNPCQRKCVCRQGYYRNPTGDCIDGAECPSESICPKPNEFFSCGSACDNECSTLHKQNRTNCPIVNIKCNERCYCEEGYARDSFGDCIPIDKCESPCKENEEFILGRSCPPDQCVSIVAKFRCNSDELEHYRCRCKSGYFRLKPHSPCIPICDCPQMANSPDCRK